jgi:hypothetical protein
MLRAVKRRRAPLSGISRTIAALGAAVVVACASGPPEPDPAPAWDDARERAAAALEATLAATPAAPAHELVVRLAFAGGADLDLWVSDPRDETVYFGNTPVRSGGALERDLRCDDATPRVETVRFAKPPAGGYRVGVDYQERCEGGENVVPWAIAIEARGERRLLRGLAEWNVFASRVAEFVY